ncbi:hypothetical protein [Arthrobacter sp. M4]|uniref:hypothetical protein n=1 Tax=Arthrobacter sp. M4 TaxID=218160 RepID=UPI001CDB7C49|nr:hypothetical protein [Arthrobacter sp. M4]MCA4132473.1 hypothetical protein [Arthrobacter sp. M4]
MGVLAGVEPLQDVVGFFPGAPPGGDGFVQGFRQVAVADLIDGVFIVGRGLGGREGRRCASLTPAPVAV